MIPLTLKEIAEATSAVLDGADPDGLVVSLVTDSRAAGAGSLFVALAGGHADGHAFVRAAFENGATAALVSDALAPGDGGAMLRVADPLQALARLAELVRSRLRATVIAITGSSGKTCTKRMTAAAVERERTTVASLDLLNAELGVPLTMCSADESTDVLVVEVGARGVGHIAALMHAVRPDVSVVTNVGPAHVGMFGSLENTARAKAELVEALSPEGVAVLNADDPVVVAMAERARGSVITFGVDANAAVRATDIVLDDRARASFDIVTANERASVRLRMAGEHMVPNALAAAAAAIAAGVSLDAAAAGISNCEGPAMRMQIRESGARVIIDDTYNANPDSMTAALKTLVSIGRGRPTWAVLGYMAELGDDEREAHDRIGRMAVRLGVGHLITVGDDALPLHEAARLEGMPPEEAILVPDARAAVDALRARLEPDAVVLVKASRAAGLERVIEGLAEDDA